MAFFKQLRLLLRQKILLRRRQPTTLLLELFWPAFVFLTILVARWQFPPIFRQTCYYNAKALPSSGMVNLLQSYVCNLDNPCLNESQYQEVPNYPNASIHAMVDQLLPLLTNRDVTEVINDLPKGIRLIAAIIDTLSVPSVQRMLEDGFPLRSAIRPAGWKRLEQELTRLESTLVPSTDVDLVNLSDPVENTFSSTSVRSYDILVNASLNLMQFGLHSDSSAGFPTSLRSFRDVICDHTQLGKFLIVARPHHLPLLSRHLCLLERKDLYYLFDLAQEYIDFGQILGQISQIFRSVGLEEHQEHVDNLIAMIGTIERANLFPLVTALRNTSWLYDAPSLYTVLRSGEIDITTLLKIVNDIEPMFGAADLFTTEQDKQLNQLKQQQQLEYLMKFYNLDDSSLRNVAELSSEDEVVTTDSDYLDREENEQELSLQEVGDLEASESRASPQQTSSASPNYPNDSLSRKFFPKLLANMDKLIDGAERFTRTAQWDSLLGAFQGLQMVLEMAVDATPDESSKQKISSVNIEQFILNFPKKIQAFNSFFNSIVPEKFQPLVYPLFSLTQRISDSMLQHLSGAFTRALAEDKIYYFDKLAQLLIGSIHNGTFPRKCIDMQRAMCDFEHFQSVFVNSVDEDTGEVSVVVEEDEGTLQGIQELGCLFFGQNYSTPNVEESTPILAKLYYTLSTLNDTNQLSSSLAELTSNTSGNSTNSNSDDAFWTTFTSRMLEVYLLATKSVNANTWENIFGQMRRVWKLNRRLFDRTILVSRMLQLSANCFIPERILKSPIWRSMHRKNMIMNEIFNIFLDEVNQAAENEALKVQQLSMGSPTLHHFLHQNLNLLPVLVDAAFETVFTNLPQFIEKMFQSYSGLIGGWPCNRFSLVDLLTIKKPEHRSQIYSAEDFLCRQLQMRPGELGRIVDELVAPTNNESRVAPLIRVLQSNSINLSVIHEHLPPLDWVEAATSFSLIKDSVEKLLSMDTMVWFPEIEPLDSNVRNSFSHGRDMFNQFYTQGPGGLFSYLGDIVTPLVIRHMQLNETFSTTCDNGVAGVLMAPVYNDKEWRCFFVSLKYASYSIRHLLELFNQVMSNFLRVTEQVDSESSSNSSFECQIFKAEGHNSSNILFLVDHIPEVLELALNEVLLGDINRLSRAPSLHQLMCSSNLNLDTFGPRRTLYADVRRSLCRISTEVSACTQLTMPERWIEAFGHLNIVWYRESLETLASNATFVETYHSVYRFLSLFGQFSPKFFNRLMTRFESSRGQNFIRDVLRQMNQLEYFRHKRFVYVMQSIGRDLHQALFGGQFITQMPRYSEERRDLIMALIYALEELPARLRQRYKLGSIYVKPSTVTTNEDELLQVDLLDALLDWLDNHLLVVSETFLQTIALDRQRLSKLFQNKYDTVSVWRSLCRGSVSQYFVVDNQISISATKAKEEICQLDFNSVFDQWYRRAKPFLATHTNQELISVLLVKLGSVLDLVLGDIIYKRDLLKMDEWRPIMIKLNRLVLGSANTTPNTSWVVDSVAEFMQSLFHSQSIESIQQMLTRTHCSLNTIPPEGLNWELVPTVYRNKTEMMAFYSTLNSAFTLGTVVLNTFLSQPKFYNHLQMVAKMGRQGFCQLKTEQDFGEVFAFVPSSSSSESIFVLRHLQTLLCQSSHNFLYSVNPVSKCFEMPINTTNTFSKDLKALQLQLEVIFSQSKSARNEVYFDDNQSVPPVLDLKQWNQFFKWWAKEIAPYPNSGRTLLAMRSFQIMDVFADNHVIWKAFYRLTFICSEMFAYSLRALQLSDTMYPMRPDLKVDPSRISPLRILASNGTSNGRGLSALLTATVSNLIFPEVNHFITFATFRQLRWIRHISHYFAKHPNILHDELCPTLNSLHSQKNVANNSEPVLVIVDDDFNDLLLLLCHNHPADWIYSLTFKSNLFNIKVKPRPKFISHRKIRERIGKLALVLARMLEYNSAKNNEKLDHVVRFLKLQQLESIENVAGTGAILLQTVMHSQNNTHNQAKSTFKEILKTTWRSVPAMLDAVDAYICSYKNSNVTADDVTDESEHFRYRPRAPDMRVVMCEMPRWDFDRAYTYLSKHLDLKNMLLVFSSSHVVNPLEQSTTQCRSNCVTPLRFLSRWVDVGQDIFEQLSTVSFWSELKSCRRRHLIQLIASSKSSSNTFLLRHSLRYVRFMNRFLATVNKFSRDNDQVSWYNVRQLWRTFSYFVLNQVPAYVPITDIVRHDVNLSEYLNATLDRTSTLSRSRAKQAIRLLADSMLDINAIAWHNFSNIALREMICKQQENVKMINSKHQYLPIIVKLNQAKDWASLNLTGTPQETLYETLCKQMNLMPLIDSLLAILDQKSIQGRLGEIQRAELTRGEWMSEVLMPEMSQLGSEMAASGLLADVRHQIGLLHELPGGQVEVSSSQKGINHLLISFVSLTRAKNFNALYDSVKHAIDKLMPRFSEGPIVDSLTRILDGLRSLKDLSKRGLFHIKYTISDLLVNVENVKIFLELNLGLERTAISQILNSTIDLSQFIEMSASVSFDSSAFCNQTLLFGDLCLQLPRDSLGKPLTQEVITNALCTLSVTEDFKFNNQILNQLVIRKLTHNIVSLILNGLLKKANIESGQVGKALNSVRAASTAMPHVKSFLRNISSSLDYVDDELGEMPPFNGSLQTLSLSYASNLMGKIVCGSSSPALNHEIKMLKVKVQQPKLNPNERNTFSSDFCREGYRQIMEMQGGPVIWNFIKPILVGKILYTPKAPVTDQLVAHMNTTLRFMPRIVEMLHAWSQTLSSLETFYYQSDVTRRMNHVKHLIESVFVHGEADGLFDDFDTFNLIEKMTRSGNVLAIVKLIGQIAQCASFDRFVGLRDETELEERARELTRSHEFIAGLVFVGNASDFRDMTTLPDNIQYKIRIDVDFVPSTKALKARIWEPGPRDHYLNDMGYLHGFVQIQDMVDRSIMSLLTNRTQLPIEPEVHLQQQPYLCYGIDKYGNYIRSLAPLITTMAWIFLIAHLIREHVLERELHLEEVMRVMGLKSGVAWLAWFIIGITVMAFATLSGIFLLYIGQLIPASDPLLLFLFFMVFNISLLMFCYMMSAFFKTATIAALSGIVAYLASFLPFMVAITLENEMNFVQKVITCFSMSTSFCFGMMYMTRFEVQGVGMQWTNLWHSPMQGDTMNVGTAMIMMGVDSCLYFLVAWYISHVSPPGNNARRYSWFFFLTYSYWKYDFLRSFGFGEDEPISLGDDHESVYSSPSEVKPEHESEECSEDNLSVVIENDGTFNIVDPEEYKSLSGKGFFQFLSEDSTMIADGTLKTLSGTLRKAIQQQATLTRKSSSSSGSTLSRNILGMELRGLYVIYNERCNKSKHMAVSNLNLNLKEGQITTILGRNGAGKTTTINVLTGQLQPTSGTVTIYGYRIPEDFGRARRLLGYCPQYNTLFNNLTVREHLLFFGELKGLLQDAEAIEKDVDEILHNMDLWTMQHQLAKHLSGGLKRRLCVALAFVGGSKLIILDEPTASVDPVARRRIWDLIVQQKRSRTVLLTTHHMDEAEILSDEVAVIHRGKLLCVGSPLLLKSKYGCGYQLTISRQGVSLEPGVDELNQLADGYEEEEYHGTSMDTMVERPRTDIDRLMAFIKCLIPNASFVEDNNGEVILSLPQYDDHGVPHDYATFFRCLDSNIRTLGFGNYGVTSTTLEEVFLTLCNLEESNMPVDEAKLAVAKRLSYSTNSALAKTSSIYESHATSGATGGRQELILDSGLSLKSRQLYALLSKRFLHMLRDWKLLFCTLLLPCLFIAFAMAMTLIKPSFAPDPSLPLVPHIYGQSTVSFLSNLANNRSNHFRNFQLIENQLTWRDQKRVECLRPREGWRTAKCPILYENPREAALPAHLITLRGKAWDRQSRQCKCADCFGDIAAMAHIIPNPQHIAYGWLYNLSRGVEASHFLLRTQPEFMDRRWGGWTFHEAAPPTTRVQHRSRSVVKVWYDNNGYHAMPAYLSSLNNALLRANLAVAGVSNASRYQITTYSHPLHVRSAQLGDQSVMQQAGDAGIAIIILVGFIFIPTSFVFYLVRERICEEKHLQRTFGVGPALYWFSSLLWDVTILAIGIVFASAIIGFFRLPIYMSRLNLPAILTLLFFFGWAMINLVYLMEKLFTEPSLAFMGIYCLALFVGIHTMVMRLMIDVFKLIEITPTIYRLFEKVAVFFPPYLLLSGIVDVHRNQLFADIFTLFDQDTYVNPFSYELLGKHFTIFAVQGVVFFLINLAIECGLASRLIGIILSRYKGSTEVVEIDQNQESIKDEDSDVAEERRRVHRVALGLTDHVSRSNSSSPTSSTNRTCCSDSTSNSSVSSIVSDILQVFSVTKIFESMFGHKCAVNNITFSVPRGECFGLLGVNGAGKTTLFRILTGQVKATSGLASFNGRNIRQALANSCNNQSIGYCPQADALDNFLTPNEHLTIYAHLRGIPRHLINKFVRESIAKFQLQTNASMPVQALSRGNRRKLCLAIAMLGNPQLILLDEPTSGLDPQSRRYVCQNIQDAIRDRRSILLTSHSMEECDILCSRLAIMVNGRFKCIGSPQYLKHKFGTGYIITLRLSETRGNFREAIEFIKESFPQSILRAHHHTMLEFNLPTNDIPLSTIFQALQVAQSILTLQDYSVSQTTLDQVFVSFASQQVNDYDSETSKSKSSVSKSVTSEPSKTQKTRSSFSMRHCTKNSFKRHASILVSLCRENKRAKSPKSKELPDKKQPTPKRSGASVDSVVRNTQMRRASNHNQLISNLLLSASPKVVKSKTLMAARHKIHAKAAWPKNHSFGEYLSSGGYPVVGGNKAAPPKLKTSGVVGDIRDRQTMVSYLAAPSQHYHHDSSGYRAPHPHVQQGAASSSTHGGSYARVAKLNTTSRAIVPTRHHYQQHLNQQHHHHQHHHQQNHQHHPHHHQSTTALAKPKTYHPRQMKL